MRPEALALALWAVACTLAHGGRGVGPAQPPAEPSAVALQAKVNASIASGAASLAVLPAAEFYFNAEPLRLSRAKGLTLDGTGSALWFSVGGGLLLDRCVDTTVVGFTLDYDPPAFFQVPTSTPHPPTHPPHTHHTPHTYPFAGKLKKELRIFNESGA